MKSIIRGQGYQDFKTSKGILTLPVIFQIVDTPFCSLIDIWKEDKHLKQMILLYIHLNRQSPSGKQWYRISKQEKLPCVTPKLLNKLIKYFNI